MYPAGSLQFKAQFNTHVGGIFVWIYFTRVNISGKLHPLNDEATELPGFRPRSPAYADRNERPDPLDCSDFQANIQRHNGVEIYHTTF